MSQQLFPRVSQFTYLLQSYVPNDSVPTFVEIINTESTIFNEYYSSMYQRMEHYPNLQYVFLTLNTKNEIYAFMAKFPLFLNKVNVAVYTFQMQKIFNTHEIPFCCILNEKSAVVYKGIIQTINYDVIISRLNETHREQKVFISVKKPELSNNQLGIVLSGITSKHQNKSHSFTQLFKSKFKNKQVLQPQSSYKIDPLATVAKVVKITIKQEAVLYWKNSIVASIQLAANSLLAAKIAVSAEYISKMTMQYWNQATPNYHC
ncbi:Conserved_hypothetical protein [Hexamita inflata]|uniref:Uncharacterized protein n=1 Tax=Hexamita inflata TaxID=28002 RepID=A0AA86RBT9_9EUKA|nr:Conserved hypothetical protein [Hexamita inflata]